MLGLECSSFSTAGIKYRTKNASLPTCTMCNIPSESSLEIRKWTGLKSTTRLHRDQAHQLKSQPAEIGPTKDQRVATLRSNVDVFLALLALKTK